MKKFFRHPFVLSLLIIAVAIFMNGQGWLESPKNVFFQLTGSFQKIIYQIAQKINGITGEENNNLREENAQLLGEVAFLKRVEQENNFLREQIGLSANEERELILAEVIGYDILGSNRQFLINKGKEDGVEEGMVVISAGNLLVGQVIEALGSFAKVRLLADPNSKVNALIQESGITGLVKSAQGLDLVIDLLPQGEEINSGETVVSSGLAGIFPSGLLIGQIQKVISSDARISQTAKIKPVVDFMKLERVFVIK